MAVARLTWLGSLQYIDLAGRQVKGLGVLGSLPCRVNNPRAETGPGTEPGLGGG